MEQTHCQSKITFSGKGTASVPSAACAQCFLSSGNTKKPQNMLQRPNLSEAFFFHLFGIRKPNMEANWGAYALGGEKKNKKKANDNLSLK